MADNRHVLIVEARYYENIADELARGAISVLDSNGVSYTRYAVPGAFELPAAIAFCLSALERSPKAVRFDGYLALGCVILGETDHYEHICRETSHGLMSLALTHCLPLGFGLLTCRNYEQALVRASVGGKNKGAEAARACVRMMDLKSILDPSQP